MLNTTFFQLLASLSPKEVNEFYYFARGAYRQQHIPLRLLNYIFSDGTQLSNWNELTVEAAYFATFDEKLQTLKQKKQLSNTLADLNNWLMDYLIWKEVKSDTSIKKLFLARIFQKKNLSKQFKKNFNQIHKELKDRTSDFWRPIKLLLLHYLTHFYSVTNKISLEAKSGQLVMDYLDEFYLQAKLRFASELLNRRNLLSEQQPILLLNEIQKEVEKPIYLKKDYLQLYYWISRLNDEHQIAQYERVKYLSRIIEFVDKNEALEVLQYQLHYFNYQIRLGNLEHIKESYGLYKYGLKKDLFTLDGLFPSSLFISIVNIASNQGELDWVASFISDYGNKLPKEIATDVILLSESRVLMYRKEYGKALKCLSKLSTNIPQYDMVRRTRQIICFCELNESKELIINYCDNFFLYLKRNKIRSKQVLLGNRNFIKIVKAAQKKEYTKESLQKMLEEMKAIVYKPWVEDYIGRNEE